MTETIVDAAVEAGVRFFVPSQFGLADTHPLLQRYFPIFVGLWRDWGVRGGFILDLDRKRARLIGKAVVGVLEGKAGEGKTEVRIKDVDRPHPLGS
ncbi:hypothetical protein MYCTH_2128639 [Thermothelomyces thermophilus ATCC 42464]|uniref:NmrA-like domain-containing protein n=1 Tax=Thermothelomyces thermophilus (strain ATCC 42464 / BCRC 31852 / DSM 1799) TaxID=573729 RepID=G2QIU2_THET4|nr:uncharacterized protein MYCTH_2128639 [Thermothelomyces thermophilus ATCC 42464]AEO59570.1 hypothetical protein MYCTH_2128639 [Thermothelomyces thermophilus ATCC 42464]